MSAPRPAQSPNTQSIVWLRWSLSSGVLTSRLREPGLGPDTIANLQAALLQKLSVIQEGLVLVIAPPPAHS